MSDLIIRNETTWESPIYVNKWCDKLFEPAKNTLIMAMENFSKIIISESWQTQYIKLKMSQDQLEQLDIQQDNITSQTRLLIPIVWIFSYTIISALFSRTNCSDCCKLLCCTTLLQQQFQLPDECQNHRRFVAIRYWVIC